MAAKWQGQSRGTLSGYKIFIFFIEYVGLSGTYFLLFWVALYFMFFAGKARDEIFRFYNNRLGYNKLKSLLLTYKNFFVLGQTIIDKVAIFSGTKIEFSYLFEGENHLREIIAGGKGGIIISAHVGNFEMAGHFLKRLNAKINLVTTNSEHSKIKDYLDSIMTNQSNNFIFVAEDMSHIFAIRTALVNNEIICLTGDRFLDKSKAIPTMFFGETAYVPAGPFHLATRFKIPYSFVFVMKEGNRNYHFYATPGKINIGTLEDMAGEFSKELEKVVRKYPEQWFNYFDFWAE
jgi:predicted LPLAT superfamily acyltransferase